MHILFVLPSFAGGGAERVSLTLMRALDPSSVKASLVVLDGRGPLATMVPGDVSVTDLSTPHLRHALPALISIIRRLKPDAVFSTFGYVNLALLAARPLLGRKTKIVVREANMPSLSLPTTSHPAVLRAAYRLLYPRADAVICTSTQMAQEMSRDYGVAQERLVQLANPVDEVALCKAASPAKRTEGEGLRLIAAGRLTHQKGFDRLIDMTAELPASTRVTLLGDGPLRDALERHAREKGVAEQIQFLGFCDNPWTHYAGADAFVMTSRWEGLPNAALEALACGVPVIATPQSGGIEDIASAAPDGAVMVQDVGEPFVSALKKIQPSPSIALSPRPSLLPQRFRMLHVAEAFHDCMSKLMSR